MQIREQITNDTKDAMKAKDQLRIDTLRGITSAIKNREIDSRPNPITPDDILAVIKKLAKQRKESIEQFAAAGRNDLAEKESAELKIIENYLPKQMDRAAIEQIVADVIAETKASSVKDMGAVMKGVMAKTAGAADNKLVSELIKAKLQPA